ncbi:Hypothetical protein AA314_06487 [Archangium gephyra]|uniref:Uncharacterized protein n=1 Tax=Archangium gephyra TaxID=48 RepID=A0AAC8THR9_9BACT|nr:Hypothetical protein AA314_06487 [Archangium gephyra]
MDQGPWEAAPDPVMRSVLAGVRTETDTLTPTLSRGEREEWLEWGRQV